MAAVFTDANFDSEVIASDKLTVVISGLPGVALV
jgi:hypothetical protein